MQAAASKRAASPRWLGRAHSSGVSCRTRVLPLQRKCRTIAAASQGSANAQSETEPIVPLSNAFKFLSVSSAGLAAVSLFFPDSLISLLLPASTDALEPLYLRIAGATLIISSAVEYCLSDSAANGTKRLSSATYQRLMVGCIVKSLFYILALVLAPRELWTQQLRVLYPAMSVMSILIQAWGLSSADGKLPGALSLQGWLPKNLTSWVYSVFALVYLGTAAACYAPPTAPSLFIGVEGPGAQLIKHTWAPGFILSAVACLNLRDAAERNRLGAGTFKRLNLGLALLELAYAAVYGTAMLTDMAVADATGLTNLVFSLCISSFTLYWWLYAKK